MTPETDTLIRHRYSSKTLDQKVKNKTDLQKDLGWPSESKRAVLCLPLGMTDELGGEMFEALLPGLLALPIELLILGKGSQKYGKFFTDLSKEKTHRVSIIPNDEEHMHRMYAAADMALFLTNPDALPELKMCLAYGVVPVAPTCKKLDPVDAIQESGQSFVFDSANVWTVFAAVVRALESHQFPFDWRTIQRHCMEHSEK